MRNILTLFIALSLGQCLLASPLNVQVKADSAILINAKTGAVLYEKRADKQQHPASTLKLASALYAMEQKGKDLDVVITAKKELLGSISEEKMIASGYSFPPHWLLPRATHIGLKPGEKMSFRKLLEGHMIASGGDASNVIAHYVSGSVDRFVTEMNQYLRGIGCQNTHFVNPHGLHHPRQLTTARDMARIAREALKFPELRRIMGLAVFERPKTAMQEAARYKAMNRLLVRGAHYYPKAIGIKTGYTENSGHTFVAAAQEGERTLIAVLFNEPKWALKFVDAKRLFEAAFKQSKVRHEVVERGVLEETLRLSGGTRALEAYIEEPVIVEYYPAERGKWHTQVEWAALSVPVERGEKVGLVTIRDEHDNLLAERPLIAAVSVYPTLSHRIHDLWNETHVLETLAACVATCFVGLLLRQTKRS